MGLRRKDAGLAKTRRVRLGYPRLADSHRRPRVTYAGGGKTMRGLVRKRVYGGCTVCGLVVAAAGFWAAGPAREAHATAVSRNGLLAIANQRGVWTIDERGTGRRLVFTDSPCFLAQPTAAFSPNGQWLAVMAYDPCRPHFEDELGAIQLTLMRMNGPRRRHVVTVPANPHVTYQDFDGPQFSPDGETVAYSVRPTDRSDDSRYTSHVVLVDMRSGGPRLIIPVAGRKPPLRLEPATSALPFAFSPDSGEIAYVPPDSSRIIVASAHTGRRVRVMWTPGGTPNGLAWGADGSLAYAAADGSIYETDSTGLKAKRLHGPAFPGLSVSETDIAPRFSPDGASLEYQRLRFGPSGPGSGAGVNVTTYTEIVPEGGGRSLDAWTDGPRFWLSAVWSGDGESIAVNGARGVYVVNTSTGRGRRIAGLFWTALAWQALPSG